MKTLTAALLLMLVCFTVSATHIINSSIKYSFIGLTPKGEEVYEISLIAYRDCIASPVSFDDSALIAVYDNSNQELLKTEKPALAKEEAVYAVMQPSAILSFPGCYRIGIYTFTFIAPLQHKGFSVVWQRCCRSSIYNIIDETGSTALAFIPAQGAANSSPTVLGFKENTVMGTNVFTELDFSNYDADGDSLVYSFSNPLSGLDTENPIATSYPTKLTGFPAVLYRNNYSFNFPLGTQTYFKLDKNTGKATLFPTKTGVFLVGITASEYRNGQLLAQHKREHLLRFLEPQHPNGIYLDVLPSGKNGLECKWSDFTLDPALSYVLFKRKENAGNWDTIAVTGKNYVDTAIDTDTVYEYFVKGITKETAWYSLIKKGKKGMGISVKEHSTYPLKIYPNPAINTMFVETDGVINTITITDLTGKIILIQPYQPHQGMDVSMLLSGVYIVQAKGNNGIITARFYKI